MVLLIILLVAIGDFLVGAVVGPWNIDEIAKGFTGLNGLL
jgi:hypothetical protein